MAVNPTKTRAESLGAHKNWMGGEGYFLSNPVNTLRMVAASCFFGEPVYYHGAEKPKKLNGNGKLAVLSGPQLDKLRTELGALDPQEWRGLAPNQLMEKAIDAALDFDPEATLKLAAELRQEWDIRTTPQVILVRAAFHPKARRPNQVSSKAECKVLGKEWVPAPESLIKKYARDIIRRTDEAAVGLAYQLSAFGRKTPKPLRDVWAASLERRDDYQLAKYRLEGHQVATKDVVAITHAHSPSINKLMGKNKAEGNSLKTTDETWESIISAKGSTKEAWEEALGVIHHMGLLRNLRNLQQAGVSPDAYLSKLVEGAKDGRQLPFRYWSAYQAVDKTNPRVVDALEQCLELSLSNLPQFPGRVMSLCDNSGSAQSNTTSSMGTMQVSTIANLSGIITGKVAGEGYLGVFGDRLETFPIRKSDGVFSQLEKAGKLAQYIGQSTENGIWLFWKDAIEKNEHWDTVFIYSDMQAGHGGLYGTDAREYRDYLWGNSGRNIDVGKLINTYRAKVNPKVQVFLVQVAGYSDTIVPEFYDRVFCIGGWGDGLLRFAHQMSQMYEQGAKPPTQG